MLSKTLDAAVKNIGLTVTDNQAYGIYGGYLLTVSENGNKKTAFFNFLLDEDQDEDNATASFNISEEIKSNIATYSIIDYDLQDDGLAVSMNQNVPAFLQMIDFCTELLNKYQVKGSEYCSYCGKDFGKRYPKKISKGNRNYLLCENCALDVYEEHNKPIEADGPVATAKNRVLGVIGAIIAGLFGIFLYFAAYKWLQPLTVDWKSWDSRYFFIAIAFIISFLVYLGYKLFCKKASLTAYISVILISVLSTIIGQYIGTIVNIMNDTSLNFNTFWHTKSLFLMPLRSTLDNSVLKDAVEYSSKFYLFAIIGVILATVGAVIFLLGLYENSKVVREELKIETLKIDK